eukprot:CAMPEP_0119125772 /NCGR_PEP_ID=MMETSP1310-20130426/4938_1 /TAXON_ID=464262 /ORGANISM="Genus nov. species nov., Strain RCC2339" /LENGTH=188 /DNA_ID=CAMNT_0007115879 /DNA_START=236 /DNA_END=798 /DNA_ORIENTATION=-
MGWTGNGGSRLLLVVVAWGVAGRGVSPREGAVTAGPGELVPLSEMCLNCLEWACTDGAGNSFRSFDAQTELACSCKVWECPGKTGNWTAPTDAPVERISGDVSPGAEPDVVAMLVHSSLLACVAFVFLVCRGNLAGNVAKRARGPELRPPSKSLVSERPSPQPLEDPADVRKPVYNMGRRRMTNLDLP